LNAFAFRAGIRTGREVAGLAAVVDRLAVDERIRRPMAPNGVGGGSRADQCRTFRRWVRSCPSLDWRSRSPGGQRCCIRGTAGRDHGIAGRAAFADAARSAARSFACIGWARRTSLSPAGCLHLDAPTVLACAGWVDADGLRDLGSRRFDRAEKAVGLLRGRAVAATLLVSESHRPAGQPISWLWRSRCSN
jgi:hypothetical protein